MRDEPAPQVAPTSTPHEKVRASANTSHSSLGRRTALAGGVAALCGLAVLHFGALVPRADDVSWQEAQRRSAVLAGFGSMRPPPVGPGEEAAAMDMLGLDPTAREQIAGDVKAGRVRLVWLAFYDSDAEDGDAVEIRNGTFRHSMVLTHAPVAVPVPFVDGLSVTITGTVDGGGGGVTVGIVAPQGPLPLPPLSVGQTVTLPILAR